MEYQKLYFDCLREAEALLKSRGRFEELLDLSTRACSIYPYEEFYLGQIDCLMSMERFKEAMDVYEKATFLLF